jgi:hypothetical protein
MAYVTVPGTLMGLTSVCTGMSLFPLAVNPVIPLPEVATHVKLVPAACEAGVTGKVWVPLQIVCAGGKITSGVGLTMISKLAFGPLQVLAAGEMVYTTESVAYPLFVIIWAVMLSAPNGV